MNTTGKHVPARIHWSLHQPGVDCLACLLGQLKLDGTTGLLLNDDGSVCDTVTRDDIAVSQSHQVTAAQLAVDREVEQRQIALFALDLKPGANGPDLPGFQRWLLAMQSTLPASRGCGVTVHSRPIFPML